MDVFEQLEAARQEVEALEGSAQYQFDLGAEMVGIAVGYIARHDTAAVLDRLEYALSSFRRHLALADEISRAKAHHYAADMQADGKLREWEGDAA